VDLQASEWLCWSVDAIWLACCCGYTCTFFPTYTLEQKTTNLKALVIFNVFLRFLSLPYAVAAVARFLVFPLFFPSSVLSRCCIVHRCVNAYGPYTYAFHHTYLLFFHSTGYTVHTFLIAFFGSSSYNRIGTW
jgi:hypothetical protein